MLELNVSLAESRCLYGSIAAAYRVENMALDEDGCLETAGYLSKYEIFQSSISGVIHGIGRSFSGGSELILARVGSTLYSYRGWKRAAQALVTGLVNDPMQRYPDVFIPLNDGKMIWCNGSDFPLVILANGRMTLPLGFQAKAAAPLITGPNQNTEWDSSGHPQPPNHYGYSVPGNIGTVASSSNTGDDGLLAGSWVYTLQLEDIFGNLSPVSNGVTQELQVRAVGFFGKEDATNYERLCTPDELRRTFAISMGVQQQNAKYLRLYRTPDTMTLGSGDLTPRLVSRMGLQRGHYFDDVSDAELLMRPASVQCAPVQPFRMGAICNGRLVASGFRGAPSLVRWSQQSFYGTWPENAVLDVGGDVTAIIEHAGSTLVFTQSHCFVIDTADDGGRIVSKTMSGCVGPNAVVLCSRDGSLLWLGTAGRAWRRDTDGGVAEIGSPIRDELRRIPGPLLARSCGFYDPQRAQVVFPLGSSYMAAWNANVSQDVLTGWSRYNVGLDVRGSCAGPSDSVLVMGIRDSEQHLYWWDRQTPLSPGGVPGTVGVPTATWESRAIRVNNMGSQTLKVTGGAVHIIESSGNATALAGASVSVQKTGRRGAYQLQPDFQESSSTILMRGSDFPKLANGQPASSAYAIMGASANNQKANWHRPDVTTERIDFTVSGTTAFSVKVSSGLPMRLLGISLEVEAVQGKTAGYNR